MADITRWDPFSEMTDLRRAFDRMFDDVRPVQVRRRPSGARKATSPSTCSRRTVRSS